MVAITARVRIMDCFYAQKKDAVSSLGVINLNVDEIRYYKAIGSM